MNELDALRAQLKDTEQRLSHLQAKHQLLRMQHIKWIETAQHWRSKFQDAQSKLASLVKDISQS